MDYFNICTVITRQKRGQLSLFLLTIAISTLNGWFFLFLKAIIVKFPLDKGIYQLDAIYEYLGKRSRWAATMCIYFKHNGKITTEKLMRYIGFVSPSEFKVVLISDRAAIHLITRLTMGSKIDQRKG